MKLITFRYGRRTEEGWAEFSKLFNEMEDVIKIDVLNDALHDLEIEKQIIMKRLYGGIKWTEY